MVLDPQGKELSRNSLHMIWIWGTAAFPFTSSREESLWRGETWRLELLVSGMDPVIYNNWVSLTFKLFFRPTYELLGYKFKK